MRAKAVWRRAKVEYSPPPGGYPDREPAYSSPGARHAYVPSFRRSTRAGRRLCLREFVTLDITLTHPITDAGARFGRIELIGLHPLWRAVAGESSLRAISADGRCRDDGHVDEQRQHSAHDDIECIRMGLWNDSARWTVLEHVQRGRNLRLSLQHPSRYDGHDRRSVSMRPVQ